MKNNLTFLLSPRSVTVIGASRSPQKVGYQILKNLIRDGFTGTIFPVNPSAQTILNLTCYPTVSNLPYPPDLALIVTPSLTVLPILEDCHRVGVKAVIIVTAGFAEIGPKGKLLQDQISALGRHTQTLIVGPNCLGVVNPHHRLNASFGPPLPQKGDVFLISQSGALMTSIFDWAAAVNLGFSSAISLGNRLGLTENDLLSFPASDPHTKVIALYLESIAQPASFFHEVSQVAKLKPIILLKGGNSAAGLKASASHTAALASNYNLLEAFAAQTGLILTQTIETWLSVIHLAHLYPKISGPNLGIVTNAGGPAVVTADHAANHALKLPDLSPSLVKALSKNLHILNPHNPLDLLGDALPETIRDAVFYCLEAKQLDLIQVLVTPQTMTQPVKTAKLLCALKNPARKPFVVSFIGGTLMDPAVKIFKTGGLPHFPFPNDAISALSKLTHYHTFRPSLAPFPNPHQSPLTSSQLNLNTSRLSPSSSLADFFSILKSYQFKLPRYRFIRSINDVPEAINFVARPAVFKTGHPHLAHKLKVGGVILDVMTSTQGRLAFRHLESLHPDVLVEQTIDSPLELILGAKRDPVFGPFIVIGLGGTYTNVLADREYVFIPASKPVLTSVFLKTKAFQCLSQINLNPELIIELMVKLTALFLDLPIIQEVEINPVLLTQKTAYVGDLKITLQ